MLKILLALILPLPLSLTVTTQDETGTPLKPLTAVPVIATWTANDAATMVSSQDAAVTKVVNEKTATTFDCRNANDYRFVVIENPKRKKDSDPVIPEDLNIVVGEEVIS